MLFFSAATNCQRKIGQSLENTQTHAHLDTHIKLKQCDQSQKYSSYTGFAYYACFRLTVGTREHPDTKTICKTPHGLGTEPGISLP